MTKHTVIYKKNGQWHRTLVNEKSHKDTRPHADELELAGYPAIIHEISMLDKIGMPDDDQDGIDSILADIPIPEFEITAEQMERLQDNS